MTVSYYSSTGRLRFDAAPSEPRKPALMALADDPFSPDAVIEARPRVDGILPLKPTIPKIVAGLSAAVLVATLALMVHS